MEDCINFFLWNVINAYYESFRIITVFLERFLLSQ